MPSRGTARGLLDALIDPHRGVSRAAFEALRKKHPSLPTSALKEVLDPGSPPHVLLNSIRLLEADEKWQALAPLLLLTTDRNRGVAARAMEGMKRWLRFDRSGARPPTPDQLTVIEEALRQVNVDLPGEITDEVRLILNFFKRG